MEVAANKMRSPLSFHVAGFHSKSELICISHLQAAHLTSLVHFASAICLMAVVVHAIMPEDLLLDFKVVSDFFVNLSMPLYCCVVPN